MSGGEVDKMQALQKVTAAKIQSVLSQEQKGAWTSMLGQAFQLAQRIDAVQLF